MGRPRGRQNTFVKLSGKENRVKELMDQGLTKSTMAKMLGVHRITVANFIKERIKGKIT